MHRGSSRSALFACLLGVAGLVACGSAPVRTASESPSAPKIVESSCGAALPLAVHLEPLSEQGSAVALARYDKKLLAFVAHRTAQRIDVLDVRAMKTLAAMPLAGSPEQVLAREDGRLIVTLADRGAIQVVSVGPELTAISSTGVCVLPMGRGASGIAGSSDGARVVVTSTDDAVVDVLEAASLQVQKRALVARSPMGVTVVDDRAFVSHLAGDAVSVVDLGSSAAPREIDVRLLPATERGVREVLDERRHGGQGYALVSVVLDPPGHSKGNVEKPPVEGRTPRRRVVLPQVSIAPGDDRVRATYYGPPPAAGISKEMPVAVSIDPEQEKPRSRQVVSMGDHLFARECLLPRAAAVRASTWHLYVGCRGIDELLELDAAAIDPMRAVTNRFALSKGVSGVAIADEEGLAVAVSEFEDAVDVVDLEKGVTKKIALGAGTQKLADSYRAGRELFYRTDDPRLAFDGVSCASCHPDGREDGITWSTPEGPRQTPMLAGKVHATEPYGWTRGVGNLPDYIKTTVERLGGSGIDDSELAALASYVERMPAPTMPESDSPAVSHGFSVFMSSGCATCHVAGDGTDKTAHSFELNAGSYDTPTLRFVGLTAPYFHDGRYPTLKALLDDKQNEMGWPAKLSQGDRDDLQSYLESL